MRRDLVAARAGCAYVVLFGGVWCVDEDMEARGTAATTTYNLAEVNHA